MAAQTTAVNKTASAFASSSLIIFVFMRMFWLFFFFFAMDVNVDVLLNIHANIREAWTYVDSESYIIRNGQIYLWRAYFNQTRVGAEFYKANKLVLIW